MEQANMDKDTRQLAEGFFPGNSIRHPRQVIKVGGVKQELAERLTRGDNLSNSEWDFVNSRMDGYVKVDSKIILHKLVGQSVKRYGNKVSLNWMDISQIDSIACIFYGFRDFNGDVSRWDTSSVTNMEAAFCDCRAFNGDVSRWDTSQVTNMREMFEECHSFAGDVSGWDTSHVMNMMLMFYACGQFNGDVSRWDVSSCRNFTKMFSGCKALCRDLSGWVPDEMVPHDWMFAGCPLMKEEYKPEF